MADAMTAVGAKQFVFTPFQDVGHSIHNLGYDYPGFIDWLFAQSLPAPIVDPSAGGAGGGPGSGTAGVAGGATANGGAATLGGTSTGGVMPSGASNGGTGGVAGAVTMLPSGGSSGASSVGNATSSDAGSCAFAASAQRSGALAAFGVTLSLLLVLRPLRRRRGSRLPKAEPRP
jgi:hypothetical protein